MRTCVLTLVVVMPVVRYAQERTFARTLPPNDLSAVVAYVASLNGIAAPAGRGLFFDAVRGVDRCSTCHEVDGLGIPVAGAMMAIPADARATARARDASCNGREGAG